MEEDLHRRLGRPRRTVCGRLLHGNTAHTNREGISPARPRRWMRCAGRGRHSARLVPRFLQHRFLFYPRPLHGTPRTERSIVGDDVLAVMEGRDPTEFTLREKATFIAQGVMSGKIFELAKPGNVSLWKGLSKHFARPKVKAQLAKEMEGVTEPERRTFLMANLVCEQLTFRLFEKFVQQLRTGNVIESMQALSGIAPILVLLSPYIYAFHSQAPSRRRLREIFLQITGAIPPALQNRKRAWFTDTLEDVNGVANTIRKMTAAGVAAGEELIVVTSRRDLKVDDIPIKNFRPIGEFELPEYELQRLSFPPIMQILDYVQQEQFTEIIISTPGPIGLTGLLAAKMLNLQTSGIYHTDIPEYVRILTEDRFLESLAWSYMQWLYEQIDTVFVNSEQYRKCWIDRGFAPEKLKDRKS